MSADDCEMKKYRARAVLAVGPDLQRHEVMMAFKGEPGEEEFDLCVRVPAGSVAALHIQLLNAISEIEHAGGSTNAAMQPVKLSGAQAANPICGECALLLALGPVQVPVVMSKAVANHLVSSLDEALRSLGSPLKPSRLC